MYGFSSSGVMIDPIPGRTMLFARETDQDLEFDEGLEDDELDQQKPPSRRPLLWILVLVVVGAAVYWTMQPDWSFLTKNNDSPNQENLVNVDPVSPGGPKATPYFSTPIPTPRFREGQEVFLVESSGIQTALPTLSSDPSGTQPGPPVQPSDALSIIDGEILGKEWIYHVRTKSGRTGWVKGKNLRPNS